jgi:hypothetical protein
MVRWRSGLDTSVLGGALIAAMLVNSLTRTTARETAAAEIWSQAGFARRMWGGFSRHAASRAMWTPDGRFTTCAERRTFSIGRGPVARHGRR